MIGFMDRNFETHVIPRLYQGGVDVVREHRDKGHVTVIATAAGEYIAERVRVQLGADDIIASYTPTDGDHMTSDELGPMAFMEGKLDMAAEYCESKGADMKECWFYSDSASDLPLLEAVGHPVMVNPQLKLRQETRGRGWPVLHFREYAKFDEIKRPERLVNPDMTRAMLAYEASLLAD
jgi:phosphoserine phosphatase